MVPILFEAVKYFFSEHNTLLKRGEQALTDDIYVYNNNNNVNNYALFYVADSHLVFFLCGFLFYI